MQGNPPQFEVVNCDAALQQINNYDCGVMALEYFRFLINDRPVQELLLHSNQDQRLNYCSSLYKFGIGVLDAHDGV